LKKEDVQEHVKLTHRSFADYHKNAEISGTLIEMTSHSAAFEIVENPRYFS
jgi:hypothetical protein